MSCTLLISSKFYLTIEPQNKRLFRNIVDNYFEHEAIDKKWLSIMSTKDKFLSLGYLFVLRMVGFNW